MMLNTLAMGGSTQSYFTISDKNKFATAGKIKIEQSYSPRTGGDLQSSTRSLIQLNFLIIILLQIW
jgi:hypothetical protein